MAGAEVITGQEGVQGLKNDRRVRMQIKDRLEENGKNQFGV